MRCVLVCAAVLLTFAWLAGTADAAKDASFTWGDWAFSECRRLVRERKKANVKRGYCEAVQEALEMYLESTGNQLAEAMGVSFSGEMGPRLSQQPYKMQGEEGVRKMVSEALDKNEYESNHVSHALSSWASGWLLHAAANDQQPRGGLPPNFDMDAIKRQMAEQQAGKAVATDKEAPAASSGPTNDATAVDGSSDDL